MITSEHFKPTRDCFIEGMSRIAQFWGMPKALGAIYGAVYLSAEPLSLDDLVVQAQVSKGAVSTHIRALERLQMVRREFKRGDRKDYYVAEPDLWRVVKGVLEQRRKTEFGSALGSVSESLELLELSKPRHGDAATAAFYRERLKSMQSFFNLLDSLVAGLLVLDNLRLASAKDLLSGRAKSKRERKA